MRVPRRLARVGAAADLPDAAAFDAYVGPAGEIVADVPRGILALQDGATPGGGTRYIAGGGGSADTIPHLFGLTLSNNASDANNDVDVAAGQASAIDVSTTLMLGATLTKRLDASWAVGSGNGGLDTGAKANSTTYHVWLIKREDTGVVDALYSTSAVSPVMPANYTAKRRIGAVITDSSGNILPFLQTGGWFYWMAPIQDYSSMADISGAAVNYSLTVPLGIKARAEMGISLTSLGGAAGFACISDPDLGAATILDNVIYFAGGTAAAGGRQEIITNTARQISILANSPVRMTLWTRGYYDGRDTYV